MAIRVIQWATGGVGRATVAGVIAIRTSCWWAAGSIAPTRSVRDVGELCGGEPLGIEATDDIDQLLGLESRLRHLLALHGRSRGGAPHPDVGDRRGHPVELVLSRGPG